MRPIAEVAREIGLSPSEFHPFGGELAKVPVSVAGGRTGPRGRLVLVTGITPTSHGEGKTVTAIGLAMALRQSGRRAIVCLRQPSLGPVFGIKGGASGGGRATVEPSERVNLGLTGDLYAAAEAHNLLAALVDNHLFHGNERRLLPSRIEWPRTVDVEDRVLRHIVTGVGGSPRESARESRFVITAASEVTAILALARDYPDLTDRLGRILVGWGEDGAPVRAKEFRAEGAMAALLRDALEPNLLQAADGTPALVHGGPFGNIAHGTCSRLSIELGLAASEYCVVEAGFATELGAEKFVDIVCRLTGFAVSSGVLVTTVRALRYHGGVAESQSGIPDRAAVERGLANLAQHLDNLSALHIEPVVALNRFPGDTEEELLTVERYCASRGVPCARSTPFSDGADGAIELASRVVAASELGHTSAPLYPEGTALPDALERIAKQLYGAAEVRFDPDASAELDRLGRARELDGPVCVAKTALSLSHDPALRGRPSGFTPTVRQLSRSAGAGFTVAYLGSIETMPGLPSHPLSERIALTPDGEVRGLS